MTVWVEARLKGSNNGGELFWYGFQMGNILEKKLEKIEEHCIKQMLESVCPSNTQNEK